MASRAERFDVAVVGIGLIGAAVLQYLSVVGASCVGIGPAEPVELTTHAGRFASHYDSGRVTRILDHRIERSILARRSIAHYARLGAATGIEFHRPVGVVLTAHDPTHLDAIERVVGALDVTGVSRSFSDHRLMLPERVGVLVEPAPAGHIDPREMLRAQLTLAARQGAEIDRREVVGVRRVGGGWALEMSNGAELAAERLVVAAGAHLDEIAGIDVRALFEVSGETIVMATVDPAEHERLDGLPALVSQLDGPIDDIYMVPPTRYPDGSVRLKLGASRRDAPSLPDFATRHAWMSTPPADDELARLRRVLDTTVPGLRASAYTAKPCLIAGTASGLPVIDTLDDRLVLAAGCNGSAAKCADAIGELAAQLVLQGRWSDVELDAAAFSVTAHEPSTRAAEDDR